MKKLKVQRYTKSKSSKSKKSNKESKNVSCFFKRKNLKKKQFEKVKKKTTQSQKKKFYFRKKVGRTRLMFVVFLRRVMSTLQWSRQEKKVSFSACMLLLGKFAIVVCCAEVLFQPSFHCVVNTLLAELCHGAYHGTEHCTD